MVNSKYADAYKEVLIVINKLNKDDFEKIPKKYIDFFEANCNNEYNFIYDNSKSVDQQELLDYTKYILFGLFEKFGATDIQKTKIKSYKINYNTKLEEQKREKYNPNDIFKNRNTTINDIDINQDIQEQLNEEYNNNLPMEVQKQNIFQRLLSFIKKIIHK